MGKTFLTPRDWGVEVNTQMRNGKTFAEAVKDLNAKGIYKDLRNAEDLEKGVKPEAKYAEPKGVQQSEQSAKEIAELKAEIAELKKAIGKKVK